MKRRTIEIIIDLLIFLISQYFVLQINAIISLQIPNIKNEDRALPTVQLNDSNTVRDHWQHNALHFLVWFSQSQDVFNLLHISIVEYTPI